MEGRKERKGFRIPWPLWRREILRSALEARPCGRRRCRQLAHMHGDETFEIDGDAFEEVERVRERHEDLRQVGTDNSSPGERMSPLVVVVVVVGR